MSALNTDLLPFEEKLLHTPSLEEITLSKYESIFPMQLQIYLISHRFVALSDGLKSNFSEVTVEVVDCPDLQAAPFHLACNGKINKSNVLLETDFFTTETFRTEWFGNAMRNRWTTLSFTTG